MIATAKAMVAHGKGLLAMDESNSTCNKRFAAAGIAQSDEARRAYREMLLTTPGLGECISGVILYDETIRQHNADGVPFVDALRDAGIMVGIKVDLGITALAGCPNENITEGLDGLRVRLKQYFGMGARFAKWRSVFAVADAGSRGPGVPSQRCIAANAQALARYAALCQEVGLVPIIEPEVLMDGNHTLSRCGEITEDILRQVFEQLSLQRVVLEAVILKPNMVIAGLTSPMQSTVTAVAAATLQCLLRVVPAAVPGIAFLSGGQSAEQATARLNAIHVGCGQPPVRALPWPLSFSFARALQHPALEIWAGKNANCAAAQRALLHRAHCNRAALRGEYDTSMESP